MGLRVVDVRRSEVLRSQSAANSSLEAAHAKHADLSHASLTEPHFVLHEVVLVARVLAAVHAEPLVLVVVRLAREGLRLEICHAARVTYADDISD